jgi:hypothetical protein
VFAFVGSILLAGSRSDGGGFGGGLVYFVLGVAPVLVSVALFAQIVRNALSELSNAPRPTLAREPVAEKLLG